MTNGLETSKDKGAAPVGEKPAGEVSAAAANTQETATTGAHAASSKKKRRLAKAFPLPLEKARKSLKEGVREKFSLTAGELAWLVETKERLMSANMPVKKSMLVRAGLTLLRDLDDEQLKALLVNLPELH